MIPLTVQIVLIVVASVLSGMAGLLAGRFVFARPAATPSAPPPAAEPVGRAEIDEANAARDRAKTRVGELEAALAAMEVARDEALAQQGDTDALDALQRKHDVVVARARETEVALADCRRDFNTMRTSQVTGAARIAVLEAELAGLRGDAGAVEEPLAEETPSEPTEPYADPTPAPTPPRTDAPPSAPEPAAAGPATPAEPEAQLPAPPKPDDLRKLEGIGPKIQRLLRENGVQTYGQLADANIEDLRGYVMQGGKHMRAHDPSAWPEQAALARDGEWEALAQLKDRLRAERG